MKKMKFRTLAYMSHSANDLYWFILPLVLPYMLRQFSLPFSSGGAILTGYMLMVALFSFLLGKFSDRFARWKLMTLGFLVATVGFACLGLLSGAPRFGLSAFMPILLVTAVGVSAFHPTMYAILDERTTEDRNKVFGRYEMWGTFGILVMYLINGFLLDYIGWQGAILTAALPGALMVVLLPVFRGALEAPAIETPKEEAAAAGRSAKRPASHLALFLASAMFRIMSAVAVLNFLPTYFSLGLGMPPDLTSYMSGVYFVGGIAAGFLYGRMSGSRGPFVMMLVFSALIGFLIILLSLLTVPWVLPAATLAYGFAMSACVPAQNLILTSLSNRSGRGETFGILMGVMTFVNALSPFLLGLLADAVGLRSAVRIFSIPAFIGWFIYLILYLRLRKEIH